MTQAAARKRNAMIWLLRYGAGKSTRDLSALFDLSFFEIGRICDEQDHDIRRAAGSETVRPTSASTQRLSEVGALGAEFDWPSEQRNNGASPPRRIRCRR